MMDQSDAQGLRQIPFCSPVGTAATSRARHAVVAEQVTAELPIYSAHRRPRRDRRSSGFVIRGNVMLVNRVVSIGK
jgi:hypothetical protein